MTVNLVARKGGNWRCFVWFCAFGYLGRGISSFNKGPHETNFGEFGIGAVFQFFNGCDLFGTGIQR